MLFSTSLASWTRNLATRQTQFSSATALPNNFGTCSYIPLEMSDSPVMSRNYTKNISVIHLVKLMLTSRAINLRQIAPTLRIDLRLHFRLAHRPLQHQKVWAQGVSHTQDTGASRPFDKEMAAINVGRESGKSSLETLVKNSPITASLWRDSPVFNPKRTFAREVSCLIHEI